MNNSAAVLGSILDQGSYNEEMTNLLYGSAMSQNNFDLIQPATTQTFQGLGELNLKGLLSNLANNNEPK